MSETWRRIQTLVLAGDYLISDHGFEELRQDDIILEEVLDGIAEAVPVEDYPDRPRGPSVLVLQRDFTGEPLHVLWALPAGKRFPAVLVTAYRPDPASWDPDFKQRKVP